MKLYYFTWRRTADEAPTVYSDIIATHPLIYRKEQADEGFFLEVLWWKELDHEEIMLIHGDDEILDPNLIKNYLGNYGAGKVLCGECSTACEETTGKEVYPHREDLYHLKFFQCPKCGARCGVNASTGKPSGTPAGPETRRARQEAHTYLDKLWKNGGPMTRKEVYAWLQGVMGLTSEECHIAKMNVDQAEMVANLADIYFKKLSSEGKRPYTNPDDSYDVDDEIPF